MQTPGLDNYLQNFSRDNLRIEDAYYEWSRTVRHPEADMDHIPTAVVYIDVGGTLCPRDRQK
eukprot:11083730-Karenia_brevis.AAC.1